MSVNIDSKLLEALQSSTCFGIAYDPEVPECKQCDVKSQCQAKTNGVAVSTPVKKKETTASTETPKTTKGDEAKKETTKKKETAKPSSTTKKKDNPKPPASSTPKISSNAPNFKEMTLEELKDLAKTNSVDWKDYGNDSITRMRLIMSLKKLYE